MPIMLTREAKKEFDRLLCEMSPENLTCDGELSASRVRSKLAALRREWRAWEKRVGRKVPEGEAYEFWREFAKGYSGEPEDSGSY